MTDREIFSAAWYCVRDAGKLTDQEMIDRLKALHGSGAQGLAMAVWAWVEAGGIDYANRT